MLQFLKLTDLSQIQKGLNDFNPEKQTWIVSDLKSKHEIQNICLKKYNFYTDDSILRISDFWRLWLRRLEPQLNIVNHDFIQSMVQLFLDEYKEILGLSENDFSTLYQYVQQLAPICLHPQSEDLLSEWVIGQQDTKKWIQWYKIARSCITHIVFDKKIIDTKWAAAYLQTLDLQKIQWPKEIIVDLGTELTSIEMGLFKELSLKQNVLFYVPNPDWIHRYPFLFKTYTENFGYGEILNKVNSQQEKKTFKKFNRASTQLSEVKMATHQVRVWLEQGVTPENILLVAARIEDYEQVLDYYFNLDGFCINKKKVIPINSLSEIQVFLAHLKCLTNEVDFESLQQKLFNKKSHFGSLNYIQFKSLFSQLFSEDDLYRDEEIIKIFYKKIDFQKKVTREEFFSLIIKIWMDLEFSENNLRLFELIFKDLMSQSIDTEMKIIRWYQFLKLRISKKEIQVDSNPTEPILSIEVSSLMSATLHKATYRIYLGMYEEAFRNTKKSIIPIKDIETLKNSFDLAIEYPEESHLEFNLRWQADSEGAEYLFTSPHLSFTAEPLTPSLFFLENSKKNEIEIPFPIRSDLLQNNLSLREKNSDVFNELDLSYLSSTNTQRLISDLNGEEIIIDTSLGNLFHSLSAGEVENYAKCPFKLIASKGFKLKDLPDVTIDLDPRQKGSLAHALFEFCIPNLKINDVDVFIQAVSVFLEEKRIKDHLFKNEDHFWDIQKNKFKLLARKFYEFEKSKNELFSQEVEIPFNLFYDLSKQEFVSGKFHCASKDHSANKDLSKSQNQSIIEIKGRIDRLDQHKIDKYFIIYDYKSSASQISNYSNWINERQLQLLIYFFAVENIIHPNSDVKGALYYLYKNFDLTKGIIDKQVGVNDLGLSPLIKSYADSDTKNQLKDDFKTFISNLFINLNKGVFTAAPFDNTICSQCDWSKLCRARHLM